MCLEAWRKIYGVSRTKLYEVYQMFRNNYKVLSPKHRQKRIKSKLKTNIAIGWMEVYFKRIGEKMPNTISINLPCYLTQEKIYQEMKRDLESTGILVAVSRGLTISGMRSLAMCIFQR